MAPVERVRKRTLRAAEPRELLAQCRRRAIELLRRNLTPAGILAATPGRRAVRRGYTAIFGRDAAVCALGMVVSGDSELKDAAVQALHTLAAAQAQNGQIAKFVDVAQQEADFWYLGCIDSTLWWLIAVAVLHQCGHPAGLRQRYARRIQMALQWLLAQEHQRFFLLQQNEASDWADIMPRSGFVLYTNALWYLVKRFYRLGDQRATCENFNGLFHPFSAGLQQYRRARLLNDYVLRTARDRDVYLSFVNFSFYGDEGDVFGNALAVLAGLAQPAQALRIIDALQGAHAADDYPVRAVTHPIKESSRLWRPYMARHGQNQVWQYHNGGIWPMVGGFWIAALLQVGRRERAQTALLQMARACALRNWSFTEWLHGKTLAPRGMPGQSWNAAAFLLAQHLVDGGRSPLLM